jgi:hypothetical protein
MRTFLVILIALISVAIAPLTVTDVFADGEQGISIENLMTDEELEATGVADLSGRELKALNAWLLKFSRGEVGTTGVTATAASSAQSEPAPVQSKTASVHSEPAPVEATDVPPSIDNFEQQQKPGDIYSRIVGEFTGWTGKTRFPLENGQIWEQRKGWRWRTKLDSPEVRIYKNFTGAYEMEIISAERSIGVRRIK